MDLRPADFAEFFQEIHGHTPFPWQQRLVNCLANSDMWPDVLELPTGSGKTAALDAAVFHLALRADAPGRAALRIALVVDRRLVVDDAFAHAQSIEGALCHSLSADKAGAVIKEVACRLQRLAGGDEPPLIAQRLRGGVPLEHDWARTPTQPTILCSTVDQVGSRLLFRGYGVSDRMKPVHAGLLGVGNLILLDEAHLAEPFRQTLDTVRELGRADIKVALLSATPGRVSGRPFELSSEDREHAELRRRIEVRKSAELKGPVRGDMNAVAIEFAVGAREMADRLRQREIAPAVIGVVVNRVALAREVFNILRGDDATDVILLIGRSRSVDRDSVADTLAPFRTGAKQSRALARSLFIVATQCIEVGVDLDLDGLVTQAAALDALRQRFGRLNRAGRPIHAEGSIIAVAEDVAKKGDDPVYGDRIRLTWDALGAVAEHGVVDFGIEALPERLAESGINLSDLASERSNAPILMPAYLDLWSQTSPRPVADPEIALFLHGSSRCSAGVSIVWRSDISQSDLSDGATVDLKELIRLVPPRAAEAVELPLWVAHMWLRNEKGNQADVSDATERERDLPTERHNRVPSRRALRWAGHGHPDTCIVNANELRAGDLVIVPADYGGCDVFGWAPDSSLSVVDVADEAARPFWGRRCAVRIAPDIAGSKEAWDRISGVLASEELRNVELLDRLVAAMPHRTVEGGERIDSLHRSVQSQLDALGRARGRVDVHYPYAGGRTGGAILIAERGVVGDTGEHASGPTTEDDLASHTSSKPVILDEHGCRVARFATAYAETLGLDDIVADLGLAAYLHDAGKADSRFQTMLAGGDPWNRPDGPPLAKSGRSWSPHAWARAELPRGWRHEALSVRMAREHPALTHARDPALVLWLIGSHHGLGRPFFDFLDSSPGQPLPCLDVSEWQLSEAEVGPQSLKFDFDGVDWPSLFEVLKRRYGIWGLAHLEAILRLADHRASEEESAS